MWITNRKKYFQTQKVTYKKKKKKETLIFKKANSDYIKKNKKVNVYYTIRKTIF